MNSDLMLLASRSEGTRCPCCDKFVKIYRRKFNSGMALTLIHIYQAARKTNNEWLNVAHHMLDKIPNWIPYDYGKLVWWDLLKKHPGKTDDGNSKGLYRITRKGAQFVKKQIKIRSHAIEYMSNVQDFDGDQISIEQALGKKFNYNELMQENAF